MNRRKSQLVKNNERMKSKLKGCKFRLIMQNKHISDLIIVRNGIANKVYKLEDDIKRLGRKKDFKILELKKELEEADSLMDNYKKSVGLYNENAVNFDNKIVDLLAEIENLKNKSKWNKVKEFIGLR